MKVLLIRSPRLYWPFINEYDNFLLPQSLPCLAAVLLQNNIEVKVIDCMPLHIGWGNLKRIIEEEKPNIVGVGDSESLYSTEAIKVIKFTKQINKNIITVAGGAHFSHLIEESLNNLPLDFIIRGEGEYTFVELIKELEKVNPNFNNVRGLAYKEGDKIIVTEPRPLIKNLDELPLPAYHLMPMDKYGKAKYLFDSGITIHHSRGCNEKCKFCVWWVQMAEQKKENNKIVYSPKWRTKSPQRTVEEIELLYNKYKRKFLVFVDDAWNLSKWWNEEFAELLLQKNLKDLGFFAFMRADFIVRDEKEGIFSKLVKAGLLHVSIGVERELDEELTSLDKKCYTKNITRECFEILNNKYPHIFRQATFIVGIREETKESLLNLANYARSLNVDYPGFHPITPLPGTPLWDEAKSKGWIETYNFEEYDFATPIMSSKYLTRKEIEELLIEVNKRFMNIKWILKGLFTKSRYKRKMYIWWLLVLLRIFKNLLKNYINPFKAKQYFGLVKPRWYDK